MKKLLIGIKLFYRMMLGDLRGYLPAANTFLEFTKSAVWDEAGKAVNVVSAHESLQKAAKGEPIISYCPYCGQRPTNDRRMDEVRLLVHSQLGKGYSMRDINFAIEAQYWIRRLGK